MSRDLRALPKAHLHIHLEGAMRRSTLADLCARHGLEVPIATSFGSFADFEETYLAACDVLRSEDELRRLVSEVVEDAALDGAVWVEPAVYIPHHRDRLGSDDFVIEVILDELRAAAARFGIAAGLMVSSDRTLPPEDAVDQARLAVAYRGQGVVSFGLANDEAAAGPEPFAAAFAIIRDAGLLSVPHAGEHRGAESVRGALDALGADRIEHGVRAVEDAELVTRLADTGVCLDVCPTSNVMLSVCPSVSEHPLPALLAAGVRCSVNADDPLLFGPNLLAEYELCRDGLALADVDLAAVALASIAASGAPEALKKEALAAIDRWMGP